jgi:RNA polymerase sigma-70 factor (ECF subfamily)
VGFGHGAPFEIVRGLLSQVFDRGNNDVRISLLGIILELAKLISPPRLPAETFLLKIVQGAASGESNGERGDGSAYRPRRHA